jgi:flavin reductase (DIM6/NTAB) family NADH-FMN oxidoreductase RutF
MQPKQYSIAIYKDTQTLTNVENTLHCVLQIMSSEQYKLVNVLGKKTGIKYNKHQYLAKKNALVHWNGFEVLQDAFAYILLRKEACLYKADHDLYLFTVEQYKTNKALKPLYFNQLIEHKIILG